LIALLILSNQKTRREAARYALKFKSAIEKLAVPNVKHTLCHHPVLASFNYSCSHFNDWVIAFRIADDELTVYEIIHGSLLS